MLLITLVHLFLVQKMKVMLMYFVGKNGKDSVRIIYVSCLRHVSSFNVMNASVAYNNCCLSVALFLQVGLVSSITWVWWDFLLCDF